jgi:hypothetical protein
MTNLSRSEDDLIKRLGIALSTKWNSLPPYNQDQLLDQACEVEPWPAGIEVREALKSYVKQDSPDPRLDSLLAEENLMSPLGDEEISD